MNEEAISRLNTISQRLQTRAIALSNEDQDSDTALLMSALAATMDAVRSLGEALNRLGGLEGLGAAGS